MPSGRGRGDSAPGINSSKAEMLQAAGCLVHSRGPSSTREGAERLPEVLREAAAHVVSSPFPATKLHLQEAKYTLNNSRMSEQATAVGDVLGERRRNSWSIQEQREGRRWQGVGRWVGKGLGVALGWRRLRVGADVLE